MATISRKPKLKEPVKVRTKKLADGSESYYLDIYVDGKRHYEFLKLYHLPEINARVKEQNKATLAAVETIKSKRIIEITNGKAGLKNINGRSKILLNDWMQTYFEEQKRRGVRGVKLLGTVVNLISSFVGKDKIRMGDVDKDFCLKFIGWIRNDYKTTWGKQLSPKSMSGYVGYFSTALNAAVAPK